jgi:arylsulfatase
MSDRKSPRNARRTARSRETTRGRRGRTSRAARRRLVLGMAAGLLCSCAREPPAGVVVVLVDTLRAQNLGLYGYRRETSPNLATFAEDALLFEDVRSQAPCTYPSVNSILTGRDGTAFWIQKGAHIGIPEEIPSIAEVLQDRGWATLAVSASPIVRKTPSQHNRFGGFDRGFELFDEHCLWEDASCVNDRAIELLDVVRRPFFLYLHYMDPHDPWRPPERRWSAGPYHGKAFIEDGNPNPIIDLLDGKGGGRATITDQDLAHLEDLYDDEIVYFDGRFGELVAALRERGLLDRTLVAVVADHGEEFLEHDFIKHCNSVYDTEIHTPLLLRLPGVAGGRRLGAQVENLDLVPTLLDYLGIEARGLRLDGRSLRPLIENGDLLHEQVFSAWASLRAVKEGRFKLVMDLATREVALYDLEVDPGETHDVAPGHPREVRRLQYALTRWIREVEGLGSEEQALERGRQAVRRLTSLGYLN